MTITMLSVLVAVVAIGIAVFVFSRSGDHRGSQDPIEAILSEVEIFVAYGRTNDAIEKLESGLKAHPEHPQLEEKLRELRS